MANDRRTEYVIYIKMDDALADEGGNTVNTADTQTGEPISQKASAKSGDARLKKAKKTLVAGFGYARRMISPIVTNYVNTVSLRTGHDELQRRQQLILSGVNAAVDIGESIIGGAVIGGSVGAVVGAAVGVATKVIDYNVSLYNYGLERTVNSVELAEARRRAGTSWDRIGKSY
jgi:broad specificity polyphosphatase/5'/3'-nucleotidase SurE